jgi:thioredoxin 1
MGVGEIIELTDETFDQQVREGSRFVLVDFCADWCKQCSRVQERLVELSREMNGRARIACVNVDDNEEVPYRFGIRSVPTLILFKDGKMVDQLVGAAPIDTIRRMIGRASGS